MAREIHKYSPKLSVEDFLCYYFKVQTEIVAKALDGQRPVAPM